VTCSWAGPGLLKSHATTPVDQVMMQRTTILERGAILNKSDLSQSKKEEVIR